MPVVRHETLIVAPRERVFDLARSIDVHVASMGRYGETAVAGVTSGLIGAAEEVTWRARHFGVPLTLTSRITRFEPPRYFRDSMVRGPFARFDHDHHFDERDGATLMLDVFDYTSPLGAVARLADRVWLSRYVDRLLGERAAAIKEAAEAPGAAL